MRVHPTFHVSKIKPVYESTPVPASKPPPPPQFFEGGLTYKVCKLLEVRNRGQDKQFLVDWKGYGLEERCWVPAKFIVDKTLIQDFNDRPGPSGVRPRGGGYCCAPSKVVSQSCFMLLFMYCLSLPVLFCHSIVTSHFRFLDSLP